MKKICSIISVLLLCMAFAGCSQAGDQSAAGTGEEISQSRNDNEVNAGGETSQENLSSTRSGDAGQPTENSADMNMEFDLEKGTVLLNNGSEMPILGIGTFRLSDEQAENSVYWALKDGYRLIDTARIYGNELTGGKGVTFATGTPISNSMTELYTNMRYLQYGTLQKLGLGHFDSWASSFGETQTAIDRQAEEEICKNIRNQADQGKTVLVVSHRRNPSLQADFEIAMRV